MAAEIHVNNIGTTLQFTIYDQNNAVVNLSTAIVKLIFSKPDHTTLEVTPVFVTDGTDGQVKHVTVSGDLSIAGVWRVQAQITEGSFIWYSNTVSFKVYTNL